ncbi:PolC-type DNA polymerase III [bacterium 210820-DFI.6.37]|nr:PolC-type DNA polymerase III [bacterium 210820-DFI.6.37]
MAAGGGRVPGKEMKHLIESSVSWARLGSHPKEAYRFSIERAVLGKYDSVLKIQIRLNFVMPFSDVEKIEAIVKSEVEGLAGAELHFLYEDVIQTPEEITGLFIEHMIRIVNGDYAPITKTIFPEKFQLKDGILTIFALGETSVELLNKQVAIRFQKLLKQNFGIETKVVFKNHQEIYQKAYKEIEEKEKQDAEETRKRQLAAAHNRPAESPSHGTGGFGGGGTGNSWGEKKSWSRKRDKYEPVSGNRIMGKAIFGEPVPLGEVTTESGQVVVEGVLFKKAERTIKSGSKLVTLLITDKRTSLCIKFFAPEQKWIDIDTHLKSGDVVKIQGDAEWDTFDNTLTVKAKSIEKGEKQLRQDNSEEKRVELHVHTKMSAMDGLNDVKQLVKTAESWGHKAIAITDHGVVQAFPDASHAGKDIKILYGVEGYLLEDKDCILPDGTIEYKKKGTNHVIILAQNRTGLKNLYKLVSYSHLNYFYKRPRMPKSVISAHREGLIIGSACEAGEIYQAILRGEGPEEMERLVNFYDYLEIQPLINNQFLINSGRIKDREQLMDINRQIVALGEQYGKPVVATCDSHYFDEEEALYRKILMAGQGFKDIEGDKGLYFRTTEEMLEEFQYLGAETAHKVVIEAPNAIADRIERMMPVPEGKFPPKIDNSDEILREKCEKRVVAMYGDPVPPEIRARLDKELNSIINNGYSVMYMAAEMLVQKSMSDGYLVGSRGSVGSSFVATMSGITEVNPLEPHYLCPNCKHLEWGDKETYDCGVDMPEKYCPVCGTKYNQEGFSIPFETFLGFEADKEPDIDLNFAGEYQATAHKFVDEIFGAENVYKAGTIGTIQGKTAYGYVMKYFEERELPINKFEADRLTTCCEGVRRTSGQHPGGIIIVPRGHEIYEFCPVQHPANDVNSDIITTHFDYHSIDQNLLKLDILGHDVPSMIRQLQDMTGVDPLKVPLKDQRVNSIFNGIDGLDIKDPEYRFTHGSYGIPEFGTSFTRKMLDDTKPDKFADLVRISGFSHGTDVWLNNAQELIVKGIATMNDAISTRDDIMNYLRLKGLPNKDAFTIMEKVRKGKGLTQEQEDLMREHDVPDWYIDSCKKIKYMFPRAHAVAYVMMSYRIAYYKVYYPPEFYAVYFTTKAADFDEKTILKGSLAVQEKMDNITSKGNNASKKEEAEMTVLEVAYEMYARGYEFTPARLGVSDGIKFGTLDGKVLLPFVAVSGVGETAARSLAEEYEKRPYETVDEIRERAKINKTAIEELREHGVLAGLPETDQLSLF